MNTKGGALFMSTRHRQFQRPKRDGVFIGVKSHWLLARIKLVRFCWRDYVFDGGIDFLSLSSYVN